MQAVATCGNLGGGRMTSRRLCAGKVDKGVIDPRMCSLFLATMYVTYGDAMLSAAAVPRVVRAAQPERGWRDDVSAISSWRSSSARAMADMRAKPMKFRHIIAALAIFGIVGSSLTSCKTGPPPAARPFYTPGG